MTDSATAVEFITQVFAPATKSPVFISSLPNADARGSQPGERHILCRDTAAVERFVRNWDRPGRGVYSCVSTLRPGAGAGSGRSPRCKANIAETPFLHVDIDLKSVEPGIGEIVKDLAALPRPPSIVVFSGNGVHAYWLLKEAAGPSETARIEVALRRLSDLVGGDPAVAEVSRLMRLPGTHNTKGGAWTPVTMHLANYDRRYDLGDLENMVASCDRRVARKQREPSRLNVPGNQFLAFESQFGGPIGIDVQQRLAAMAHKGPGDSSVHQTQLQVSASLLSRGHSVEGVTSVLMEATKPAAGEQGSAWDWNQEEQAIRGMCDDWLRKTPNPRAQPTDTLGVGGACAERPTGADRGTSKPTSGTHTRRMIKPIDANALPNLVADAVVEAVRRERHDVLLAEGQVFFYVDGVWRPMRAAEQQWLLTLIQQAFERFGSVAKLGQLAAAWKRITEHPGLYRRSVPWAPGTVLATSNGMLDLVSRSISPHSPEAYARRKIGTAYILGADCPRFLEFLVRLFADRHPSEAAACISIVQCFFGASLAVALLSREERKALILVGPSRTGKTELARFARLLVGELVATPSVAEMSDRFGLSSLYDASAWIRDDAINEGDDLDPQRFKTIVTGEPIDIERKHRDAVRGVELAIPVVLTSNALPRARDKSDALFNRSLVLELTNVISEADAFRFRTDLAVPRGQPIAAFIFGQEGPGILNWALDGLDRLLNHGAYELPDTVRAAVQRFKDDNNPVGEWARTAIVRRGSSKVARSDLLCAFHGWQREQDGDEARALGGRGFFPRLRAAVPGLDDLTDTSGRRYVGGIALSDEGLQLWELHNVGPQLKGGSKGVSTTKMEVNRAHAGAVGSAVEAQF